MTVLVKATSLNKLTPVKLKNILARMRKNLRNRCQAAFVFGSCANGTFGQDSDIDIIVIDETSTPFVSRAKKFFGLKKIFPNTDILVYTPEEFARCLADRGSGFWKKTGSEMRKLV
jgi:predicted nucleotidyltransferase